MTTATIGNTMRLTYEQAGVLRHSVNWHLLGLGLEDNVEDRLGITSEPSGVEIMRMEDLGRSLLFSARLLRQVEQLRLSLDEDTWAFVAQFVVEAAGEVTFAADRSEQLELAIARGRLAMLRTMIEVAESIVRGGA